MKKFNHILITIVLKLNVFKKTINLRWFLEYFWYPDEFLPMTMRGQAGNLISPKEKN